MNRDKVRSLGVFVAVILVLFVLILGGVYFAKNREVSLSRQDQPAAQEQMAQNNPETPNEEEHKPQEQPAETPPATAPSSPAPSSPAPAEQAQPEAPKPADPAPAATTPSQPAPAAPAPATPEHMSAASQTPTVASEVPQTGFEPQELVLTSLLMMATVYLGVSIRRTRMNVARRMLS